jgi:hypothetical protein
MRAGDRRAPSGLTALREYTSSIGETFPGPQKYAPGETCKNGRMEGSSLDFRWQAEYVLIRLNLFQSNRAHVLLALLRFVPLGGRLKRAT